jgi:hypothetical protein
VCCRRNVQAFPGRPHAPKDIKKDIRTFAGERDGAGASDARVRAERCRAGAPAATAVCTLAVIRQRPCSQRLTWGQLFRVSKRWTRARELRILCRWSRAADRARFGRTLSLLQPLTMPVCCFLCHHVTPNVHSLRWRARIGGITRVRRIRRLGRVRWLAGICGVHGVGWVCRVLRIPGVGRIARVGRR